MSNPERDEMLFLQLVAMFQYAAMQQMGKLPSPVSGKIERDLAQARASIDILEMLHAKTETRRTARESEIMDKVLFELRMNFVDEARRPDPGGAPGDGEPDNAKPGEDGEPR